MDPLLLLCNLYADGPTTLRRLKARGIQTLAGVAEVAPDRLAEYLGGSPGAARRFQREAALASRAKTPRDLEEGALIEPLGTEPRGIEARDVEQVHAPRGAALEFNAIGNRPQSAFDLVRRAEDERAFSSSTPMRSMRIPAMPLDEIAPRAPLPSHKVDSPLAASFRGAFRVPARVQRNDPAREPRNEAATALPTRAPNPEPRLSAENRRLPTLEASALLHPGLCAGLDAQVCAKLVGEGIRTLGQLIRVPTQPLAGWIGLTPEAFVILRERASQRLDASSPSIVDAPRVSVQDDGSGGERIYELRPQPRRAPPHPVWTDQPAQPADKSALPLTRPRLSPVEDVAGPFA
jgi:hypothetical protein